MATTSIEGFLLVDKPAGATSQDVVSRVRRALRADRAGHTGTLDPFATGLLIVLLGQSTRLARYVPGEPKTYEAEIRFGFETDTDDSTGASTAEAPLPDESRVRSAMAELTGALQQVPPAYSAKQVAGRRAYAMARAGQPVVLAPVPVAVQSWRVLDRIDSRWRVRIVCGTGTYIRALARDLGRLSQSAAHLAALRRTAIGPFAVEHAVTLERLAEAPLPGPVLDAMPDLPRHRVNESEVAWLRHGRAIPASGDDRLTAVLDLAGRLVAIAERQRDCWQPRVVLDGA